MAASTRGVGVESPGEVENPGEHRASGGLNRHLVQRILEGSKALKTICSLDASRGLVPFSPEFRPRVRGCGRDVVPKRDTGFGRWSADGA